MERERWKFLAFLICCLDFAAAALSHGAGVRSKRWGHSSCRHKLGKPVHCERDRHGGGRGAASAGPWHHQHAEPPVGRHHGEPSGSSYMVTPLRWLPSSLPEHLWPAAGWAPQGCSHGQERGNTDRREKKQRGGRAGSYFSKGCSHMSWGVKGLPRFGSTLHP